MPNEIKDYLREYDNAAEDEKYPLVQQWIRDERLPFFKQLRAERPVLETPECTLVALFTDVRDMLQMPTGIHGRSIQAENGRHRPGRGLPDGARR
jgi:hypothetical protein